MDSQKAIFSRLSSWGMLMPFFNESARHAPSAAVPDAILFLIPENTEDVDVVPPPPIYQIGEGSEDLPSFFVTPRYTRGGLPGALPIPIFNLGLPPEPEEIPMRVYPTDNPLRKEMVDFARSRLDSLGVVSTMPSPHMLPSQ